MMMDTHACLLLVGAGMQALVGIAMPTRVDDDGDLVQILGIGTSGFRGLIQRNLPEGTMSSDDSTPINGQHKRMPRR